MQIASENVKKVHSLKHTPYSVTKHNFPFILQVENNISISEEEIK